MTAFQLDLLDFHGKPLELVFRASGAQMNWLFEDIDSEYSLGADEEFVLELEASLINTTVRLTGTMQGTFEYRCGRCLEIKRIVLDSEVDFVLMSRRSWQKTYESSIEIE